MKQLLQEIWKRPVGFLRGLDKHITIMVVPHRASKKTITIQLLERTAFLAAIGVGVVVLFVGVTFLYTSANSRRLVFFQSMVKQTEQQQGRIQDISEKTHELDQKVKELSRREIQIRKLLGLPVRELPSVGRKERRTPESTNLESVEGQMQVVLAIIKERHHSLVKLRAFVDRARSRYATTPSAWPIYGNIQSYYGYRATPWRGMHTGVDIKGAYGAPVRTTANGRVVFSGWRSGYGKTVIVDHGNGMSTLYGHNSKLLVSPGNLVRKGQVVSLIGMTGWTTGTHCHYEVRIYERPVNPIAFLGLSMQRAAQVLGRYRVSL